MAKIEHSIDIDVPVREAYNQWTQFETFPRFMDSVKSVRQLDDTHLHWVTEIAGQKREYDAEITEQIPDQRIAWTAIDGKPNGGLVTFQPLGDTSTKVTLRMEYETEGLLESVGDALGIVKRSVRDDLEGFKRFIESRGQETGAWRGKVA
jgi:uncharacterized membrane protein